jgi:hypothetical protein
VAVLMPVIHCYALLNNNNATLSNNFASKYKVLFEQNKFRDMTKIFFILIPLSFHLQVKAQNLGIKFNTELSTENAANLSTGAGIYVGLGNLSDKFEILFDFDFLNKNDRIENSNEATFQGSLWSYERKTIGVSGLFTAKSVSNFKFRIGPRISVSRIDESERGIHLAWIKIYKTDFIGLGITSNLHFEEVFNSRFNLDLFIIPEYFIAIKHHENSYISNLKKLDFQFGLSYPLTKNKSITKPKLH